jgi:hypothetical protein
MSEVAVIPDRDSKAAYAEQDSTKKDRLPLPVPKDGTEESEESDYMGWAHKKSIP